MTPSRREDARRLRGARQIGAKPRTNRARAGLA
jgi:hypothetical protein